jgi:threonine dehydrogenase-like Zn-dependent dehydrogenase
VDRPPAARVLRTEYLAETPVARPTPVITHRFPLENVDDAIRAIKSGEAGKVIFDVA